MIGDTHEWALRSVANTWSSRGFLTKCLQQTTAVLVDDIISDHGPRRWGASCTSDRIDLA